MPKIYSTKEETAAMRGKLLEIMAAHVWRTGNPKFDEYVTEMNKQQLRSDTAFKLIQKKRFSAGQAMLKRIQLEETRLKSLKIVLEAELLEALDDLGIEREWKTDDLTDPMPKLWIHFRMADLSLLSVDYTSDARELELI